MTKPRKKKTQDEVTDDSEKQNSRSPKKPKSRTKSNVDESELQKMDQYSSEEEEAIAGENYQKSSIINQLHEIKQDLKKVLSSQELISNLQKQIIHLSEENKKKDIKISALEKRVNDLEQYTRQDDIIISGYKSKHQTYARRAGSNLEVDNANAPEDEKTNLETEIINFFKSKDIEIDKNEISACHTLKAKQNTTPNIVIRFVNRKTKIRMLQQRKKLDKTQVYVNEHLTKHNSNLFRIARKLKKEGKIMNTFTRNCSVVVHYRMQNGDSKYAVIRDIPDFSSNGFDVHSYDNVVLYSIGNEVCLLSRYLYMFFFPVFVFAQMSHLIVMAICYTLTQSFYCLLYKLFKVLASLTNDVTL